MVAVGNRSPEAVWRLVNRISAVARWIARLPPIPRSAALGQVIWGGVVVGAVVRTVSSAPWNRVNMCGCGAGTGLRLNG